ncbi:hypothetical protein [Roseivirga thermotolerans]|uniref:hypothetical protein n=1 Tax=Roseivirga thermotolerans TaxID=1758176 RepID=UPI00273F123C|nr:hypothetical protein [Roseivirga thermotolerans]
MKNIRIWKLWLLSSAVLAIVIYFLTAINPMDLNQSSDVQLHDTYFVTRNWSFLLIWTLLFLIVNGTIALLYKLLRNFITLPTIFLLAAFSFTF